MFLWSLLINPGPGPLLMEVGLWAFIRYMSQVIRTDLVQKCRPYSLHEKVLKEVFLTSELLVGIAAVQAFVHTYGHLNAFALFCIIEYYHKDIIRYYLRSGTELLRGQRLSVNMVQRHLHDYRRGENSALETFIILGAATAAAFQLQPIYDGFLKVGHPPRVTTCDPWVETRIAYGFGLLVEILGTMAFCVKQYYSQVELDDDFKYKSMEEFFYRIRFAGLFKSTRIYFNPILALAFEWDCLMISKWSIFEFVVIDVVAHFWTVNFCINRPNWKAIIYGVHQR